jgi:lipopolysaccharide export system permease protein
MMKGMMDLLAAGKLSLGDCSFLGAMLLPSMISYALPFGFVAATLLTVGEMSANSEFIALKSSGIGPLKIFSSILLLASCGVLVALAINFHCAPRAISAVKNRIQNIIREEPLRFVTPQRFIRDFPGYIIFAKSVEQRQLRGFHIWEFDEQERVSSYIHAKRGALEYDNQKEVLVLTLFDGTAEKIIQEGKLSPLISFERFSLNLSLKSIFAKAQSHKKIRHMTLAELFALRDQSIRNGDHQKQMEVQVNMQTQCAMAFSILALVLVALPLSIGWRRKETSLNMAIAFLICITYYFFVMVLPFLGEKFRLRPDWIVWLPNIILQIEGIRQMIKMNHH